MVRELFIKISKSNNNQKIEFALLEDKKLVEYQKEKIDKKHVVGNVYLGKVKKIMNALNAAFIDIGLERDAFLHYSDLNPNFIAFNKFVQNAIKNPRNVPNLENISIDPEINKYGKISELLKPGQSILVQLIKEPIRNKGPRIRSDIFLAGRYLVLIPFSNKVAVSQKIKNKNEKQRLKQIVTSLKPKNFGVIVRTIAEGIDSIVLDNEIRFLKERWDKLVSNLANAQPPTLILKEIDIISAYLRDVLNSSFENIVVNDFNLYHKIKNYLRVIDPKSIKKLKFFDNPDADIFEFYNISKQIRSAFARIINLKKGAHLVIEQTEALYVIDVNSGKKINNKRSQEENAFEINKLAAEEIARQLRLRDIGGIIIVDFIDMHDKAHKEYIYKYMKKLMVNDRAKHTILPLSKFNLMQITRERVKQEIKLDISEPCPVCNGTGVIQPSIFIIEQIEQELKHIASTKTKYITLKVHPFIYAYLTKGLFSIKFNWKFKYTPFLKIQEQKDYHFLEYKFFDKNGEVIN